MSDKLQGGVLAGSTNVSLVAVLRSTTDNSEVTGKVHTDVTGSYWRQGGTRQSITMATLGTVDAAYSEGGFVEVDATNMPGIYRFDIPDAAFATGADWVIVAVKVSGAYVYYERFNLTTNVVQSGDAFARLGAPAGASVSADIATAQSDLDTLTGTDGATLATSQPNYAPATAAALATVDTNVDSILADTGTDGVVLSAAQMNKIADHTLRRSFATAAASSDGDTKGFRSLLGAVAKLVNKVSISGSTLTVTEADDSTSLGTQTLTTDASANPITGADTD